MSTSFDKALGFGILALLVSIALTTPLATGPVGEPTGIGAFFGRLAGYGATGIAMLLVIETPVLFILGALTRGRVSVPRLVWVLVASIVALAPIVALNLPDESVWMKISETFSAAWSQPLIFVSEWLPFVLSGAVFGWYWSPRRHA